MMPKISMKAVKPLPTSETRVIEMSMNPLNGKILLYNGLEFGTKPKELELFNSYQFAERIRLFSLDSNVNWFKYGQPLWDSLKHVKHANFQGDFRQDVIENLVSKCSALRTCSFTYWSAYDFTSIIGKITSKNLTAITAHVNGTLSNFEETLVALNGFGERIEGSLCRLFLIFKDPLPTGVNFYDYTLEKLGDTLHPFRDICLLFQDEPSPMCMTAILKSQGFQDYGTFCFAENDPASLDDTAEKAYECYKTFSKIRDSNHIVIGCRKQPKKVFSVLPKFSSEDYSGSEDELDYQFSEGVEERQFPSSIKCLNSFNPTEAFSNKVALTVSNTAALDATECCTFDKTGPIEGESLQAEECCNGPFLDYKTDPVKIQKATFHSNGKFEMFSSNGFYFAPSSFEKCNTFLNNDRTKLTERFIFSSPEHIKSLIVPGAFRRLLKDVDTVEVHGKWFTISMFQVMRRITYGSKLVFMRMSLDKIDGRSGRHTLSLLFDGLMEFARDITSEICCDARDMEPTDVSDLIQSIGGTRRPYPALENGLFFVHEASDILRNWLRDFTRLMADGKPVTLVCCEKIYEAVRLQHRLSTVLVPRIFSNRVDGSANVLMQCYAIEIDGHQVNLVMPL